MDGAPTVVEVETESVSDGRQCFPRRIQRVGVRVLSSSPRLSASTLYFNTATNGELRSVLYHTHTMHPFPCCPAFRDTVVNICCYFVADWLYYSKKVSVLQGRRGIYPFYRLFGPCSAYCVIIPTVVDPSLFLEFGQSALRCGWHHAGRKLHKLLCACVVVLLMRFLVENTCHDAV